MTRVILGPYNTAGSAWRLAKALRAAGIDAEAAAVDRPHALPLVWPADRILPPRWASPQWDRHLATFSHVLLWSGLSLRGPNRWFDADRFDRAAIVATGSELRLPLIHRQLEPHSPFGDDPFSQKLVRYSARFHRRLRRRPLPVFVHTAGMIDYRLDATWLPIIGDPASAPAPLRRRRPIVLHAPTSALLKGARYVDALDTRGFKLVRPAALLAPDAMEAAIRGCDIVIGGLVLGDYGHTEIQAMAAGRVVIANVSERVIRRMPARPPIVQATPDTLADVIADVLANRDRYRDVADSGPAFVERFHDGRYSVSQLAGFLS